MFRRNARIAWKEAAAEMRARLRSLNACLPETARGFCALSKAAKAPSALDEKTVEPVALGIAVAVRCEPCIAFHVEALVRPGATRNEVAAVLSMCIQMGSEPAPIYAAKALDCYDELSESAR